jgi:hypothetical protein
MIYAKNTEFTMIDQLDIIENINTIYSSNSSLSVLKDFERVLDEMDLYVYDNWIDGELVEGPIISRHWIKVSFMWPRNKMPDPMGAKRLLDYGCKIGYEKSHMLEPIKVKSPDDFRPGTKKGKIDRKPVWVVHISMPKELASEMYDGYMSMMKNKMGIGKNSRVDASTAQQADSMETMTQPGMPSAPGMPAPAPMPTPIAGGTNVPA